MPARTEALYVVWTESFINATARFPASISTPEEAYCDFVIWLLPEHDEQYLCDIAFPQKKPYQYLNTIYLLPFQHPPPRQSIQTRARQMLSVFHFQFSSRRGSKPYLQVSLRL